MKANALVAAVLLAGYAFGPPLDAAALTLTRPYLQLGTQSSIVVRWRTETAADSRVRYGTNPSNLSSVVDDSTSATEHVVKLTGLNPSTKYYYSVGHSEAALAGGTDHFFVAAPTPGTEQPTLIWVLGNSGTAMAKARAVRDAYFKYKGNQYTHLWLMLGDKAYHNRTDNDYQDALFNTYPTLLRQTTLWPALGHRDDRVTADSASQSSAYYDIFTLPKQGEAGGLASGTEAYYSFDYSNIHFVVLDSVESSKAPSGAMLTWLENDLAVTTQPWIIAYWDHPPCSKGFHDSDTSAKSTSVGATTQAAPDSTAPPAPTNLTANAVSSSQINLAWTSSTDNVGVTGYKVYRAGTQITTVSGTAYQNTGLSPSTTYSYTVAAYDATGNTSAQASSASATTQAPPTTTLSIKSYGATGNDTTDDTAAINDTINAAKAQGRGVYVPAGTFHHNTNFTLDSVTMVGEGDASVLVATNKAHSSIVLIGNSPAIKSVKLTSPNADVRDTTPWSTGVEVRAATDFTVGGVTVTRMGSAGIFTWQGSGPGKVVNNRVLDTLADAIHFTDKSHDIIAANNYVRGAGDDMVAIVSYLSDGAQVRNVLVQDNDVADQNWGRGLTVVGGKDVTIQRNKVARTNHGAGIMVAAENFWNTYGNDNILISDNTLTDISGPDTHQGAILMFVDPGQAANTRVRVENNTVTNARYDGIKVDGNNQDISIVGTKINKPAGAGISRFNNPTNVYCSGNLLNGSAYNPSCGGANNFTVTGSSLTYSGGGGSSSQSPPTTQSP